MIGSILIQAAETLGDSQPTVSGSACSSIRQFLQYALLTCMKGGLPNVSCLDTFSRIRLSQLYRPSCGTSHSKKPISEGVSVSLK